VSAMFIKRLTYLKPDTKQQFLLPDGSFSMHTLWKVFAKPC